MANVLLFEMYFYLKCTFMWNVLCEVNLYKVLFCALKYRRFRVSDSYKKPHWNCGFGFLIIYDKTGGFRIPNFWFGLPSLILIKFKHLGDISNTVLPHYIFRKLLFFSLKNSLLLKYMAYNILMCFLIKTPKKRIFLLGWII